jgi:hypothetical protein
MAHVIAEKPKGPRGVKTGVRNFGTWRREVGDIRHQREKRYGFFVWLMRLVARAIDRFRHLSRPGDFWGSIRYKAGNLLKITLNRIKTEKRHNWLEIK